MRGREVVVGNGSGWEDDSYGNSDSLWGGEGAQGG